LKRTTTIASCERCGQEFSGPLWHIKRRRFCSQSCAAVARNKARGRGWSLDKNGYVILTRDETGYQQPEHRRIMEKKLGRKLERHETVHHKNLVRSANSPDNLELWASRHPKGQRADDRDIWSGMVPLYHFNAVGG